MTTSIACGHICKQFKIVIFESRVVLTNNFSTVQLYSRQLLKISATVEVKEETEILLKQDMMICKGILLKYGTLKDGLLACFKGLFVHFCCSCLCIQGPVQRNVIAFTYRFDNACTLQNYALKSAFSPGRVVMGGVSCSKGCGFESQRGTLDGIFSHLFVVKIVMFVLS